MVKKTINVKKITAANFKRFGCIIEYPNRAKAQKTKNLFKIVVKQPNVGWRIAYLVVRDMFIGKLEQHPGSRESFEPVLGRGLIYCATKKDPAAIECFLLDRPVILNRGVWHGVIALSGEFDVKITENSRVKCVYWPLGFVLEGK
jgi:ureidoglycolate hydrolase